MRLLFELKQLSIGSTTKSNMSVMWIFGSLGSGLDRTRKLRRVDRSAQGKAMTMRVHDDDKKILTTRASHVIVSAKVFVCTHAAV